MITESPPAPSPERFNILGVLVSALTLDRAVAVIKEAVRDRRRGYICVTGVHGVSESQDDPALKEVHNRAFLVTPDGMPLVWLGRRLATEPVDRVYGPDLLLTVCESTADSHCRHFFYGGAPGVAEELAAELSRRFPGLTVCGTYCPPFRPLTGEETTELQQVISEARPDIIWVGLSTPKQERFMAENLPRLDTTLMIGVGAAFDFHTGRVRQAPRWMQRSGLEWLFRLIMEPRRLAGRYLRNNPLFIVRIALQLTGLRKY